MSSFLTVTINNIKTVMTVSDIVYNNEDKILVKANNITKLKPKKICNNSLYIEKPTGHSFSLRNIIININIV